MIVGFGTDATNYSLPIKWHARQPSALPTLGGPGGRAASVNDAGDIVGTSNDPLDFDIATLWRNGQAIDLGALPWPQRRSHAVSINNRGDIAGGSMAEGVPTVSLLHLVRWPGGGPIENLWPIANYLIAGTYPLPLGINDAGMIAGTRGGTTPPNVFPQRAFTWAGAFEDLPSLTGQIGGTLASSINRTGDVAGSSETASYHTHAVVWKNGTPIDLGALPNFNDFSTALAIADNGDVAGYSLDENTQPMAVLWRRGKLIKLGNPPGTFNSRAHGINDLGQIVGQATSSTTHLPRAILWTVR